MCTLALPLQCHSDQSRSADAHHQPQRTQYYTLSAQTLAIMPRALIRGARQMLTTNHSDDADLSSRLQNLFKVCAKDMPAPDLVHTETFALHKNALRTRPRPRCYKAKAVCPRPHIHSHRPVSPQNERRALQLLKEVRTRANAQYVVWLLWYNFCEHIFKELKKILVASIPPYSWSLVR